MQRHNVIAPLVAMALLFTSMATSVPAYAQPEATDLQGLGMTVKGNPKLESALDQLSAISPQAAASAFANQHGLTVTDSKVRVIIEVKAGNEEDVASRAKALGADVEASYENLVQALVPVSKLEALASDADVELVRLPLAATPTVIDEGVSLVNADEWHAGGFTGSGVKVGILDMGFSGYTSLLGTDLPATVTHWWAPSIGGEGSEIHGAACAEIVYDMAPDAEFYFANFNTEVEFGNAVSWLVAQGVSVISCSVCWANTGPGNGTGPICDVVTTARNGGVLWSQSAGNYAQTHWSGTFRDTNGNGWEEFSVSPLDETNYIYAEAGEAISVFLKWNDPWNASTNDYDLWLYDAGLNPVAYSWNVQNGSGCDPTEALYYQAPASGYYLIAIGKYSATRNVSFQLFTFQQALDYQVAADSLMEPADSASAMTMGAVPWDAPNTLEPFSSQGPTTDSRKKPDLVAPDRVSTVTYGTSGFAGTSAAAPHGAGAAVLVKDCFPSYTPAQIQSYLETNSVGLGVSGKDNLYGSGRLNLPPLPPDVPSELAATAFSSSRIDLTWQDNSDDETGFKIERKTGAGTYSQIATVGANVASYSSASLSANTTYYYRVRAYNAAGNSAYCDEAQATTLPPPPPAPTLASPASSATGLSLTPRLQWNAATGATSYGIQVATNTAFTSLVFSEIGIAGTFYDVPVDTLNWNTYYYWRANAVNSFGSGSAWSSYRRFKTALGPPPDAPSDLTATAFSSSRIDLTWQDNSDDETGFKIERKTGATGTYSQIAIVGANIASYSSASLSANTTYYYRVRAYNAAGNSAYCDEAQATTLPPPPPVPTLASPASSATGLSLTPRLQWNAATGATSYGIQVATSTAFTSLVFSQTGIAETFYDVPVDTLNWNTYYYWRANAVNSSGSGSAWSSYRRFKTALGP